MEPQQAAAALAGAVSDEFEVDAAALRLFVHGAAQWPGEHWFGVEPAGPRLVYLGGSAGAAGSRVLPLAGLAAADIAAALAAPAGLARNPAVRTRSALVNYRAGHGGAHARLSAALGARLRPGREALLAANPLYAGLAYDDVWPAPAAPATPPLDLAPAAGLAAAVEAVKVAAELARIRDEPPVPAPALAAPPRADNLPAADVAALVGDILAAPREAPAADAPRDVSALVESILTR